MIGGLFTMGDGKAATDVLQEINGCRNRYELDSVRMPEFIQTVRWLHSLLGRLRLGEKNCTCMESAGDAFIFEPGQPHQLTNDGAQDLILYIVADNPIGGSCHCPDSKKWSVISPEHRLIRSEPLDYYEGEE